MAFILDPEATSFADPDRFISMSVTRNAHAVVPQASRQPTVRASNAVDDIEGARPRALPPHQRETFYGTADIEGARPKPLHYERRNKPDFTTTNLDIERECGGGKPHSEPPPSPTRARRSRCGRGPSPPPAPVRPGRRGTGAPACRGAGRQPPAVAAYLALPHVSLFSVPPSPPLPLSQSPSPA
jgi:hypothetical protein